jgi:mycothiol synthase
VAIMREPGAGVLSWRPIVPGDTPAWYELSEAVLAGDGGSEHLSADDLRALLAAPWLDPGQDTVIGRDGAGAARAFGLVDRRPGDTTLLRAHCFGGVHPGWRGRGIGRALLAWQLDRSREMVAARRAELGPVPAWAVIGTPARPDGRPGATQRLAARFGLAPSRWFSLMRRPLAGDLPPVRVPDGLRLVPYTVDLDEAVRLAHNDAFAEHWGFQPWSPSAWRLVESGHRDFRPGWSFVVLDQDTVAGYAMSAARGAVGQVTGVVEGWTSKLGVRRPWRGRGLAKALLSASMAAFAADGMPSAGLDVDADNPTGAVALYHGLGYRLVEQAIVLTLSL